MSPPFGIRRVHPSITRPVRRQVLRPHQRLEEVVVPGEEDPEAGWFAAFDGDVVIGTAGVFPEDRSDGGPGGWRVRAMAATTPGLGVGAALLEACLAHVRGHGGLYVWASARTPAQSFYERHGFMAISEVYEPPGLGPHVTMVLEPISGQGGSQR